jgi:biotin carboxyl carrier protein
MRYDVEVQGRRRQVQVKRTNGRFAVEVDDRSWSVDAVRIDDHTLSLLVSPPSDTEPLAGGHSREIVVAANPGAGTLTARVDGVAVEVNPNTRARQARGGQGASGGGPQRMTAPMAGKVVRVLVKAGETVVARQPVVVVEAMKMENELRAARDGRVTDVAVRDGQSVEAGALLAVIADH